MMRATTLVLASALVLSGAMCQDDTPGYDLRVVLHGRDGGGVVPERQLSEGKSSLKNFTCDVSVRLGQCVAARPIQLVFVPGGEAQSGSNSCGARSASKILGDRVGQVLPLGRADDGLLWIQAFQGDDDDDSGLVDRREMNAYAELKYGTLDLRAYDADQMVGTINANDADGGSYVIGELGAVPNDYGNRGPVGPQCTWPIGAKAE